MKLKFWKKGSPALTMAFVLLLIQNAKNEKSQEQITMEHHK